MIKDQKIQRIRAIRRGQQSQMVQRKLGTQSIQRFRVCGSTGSKGSVDLDESGGLKRFKRISLGGGSKDAKESKIRKTPKGRTDSNQAKNCKGSEDSHASKDSTDSNDWNDSKGPEDSNDFRGLREFQWCLCCRSTATHHNKYAQLRLQIEYMFS